MGRRQTMLALAALVVTQVVSAQQKTSPQRVQPRRFEVRRATSAVTVDGVLDEQAWRDALAYDLPYEWMPGDNVPPPVTTEFLVTYDSRNLYVAWRCHDPEPGRIRSHLMDRDAVDTLIQDDHVVLMIDPFNDERRGWQFRLNPLGVQADAIFSENEGVEDFSYDLIWASAARITADGWVAEAAIPFAMLRFPRTSEPQTWGFDVGRSYPRSVRHRILAWPRDRDRNCILCQVDKVAGFEGLKPGLNLELDPTVTASRQDKIDAFPDGQMRTGDTDSSIGVSARWGVTTDLSLNAAINPDFSQVEADAAQLTVNERFALFYPEKRPFFLEGTDIFTTPLQAVYTRTVVDPDWGVKLTGKVGANAVGVFLDQDNVTNLLFPSNQGTDDASLDQSNRGGVVRYRRDVGRGSSVGVLYAGREGDAYHNRVWGADGFLRLGDTDTVGFQLLRSDTAYPPEVAEEHGQDVDPFGGTAWSASYQHQSREWFWELEYSDLDPGFRADSGFIPRVDTREAEAMLQRTFWTQPGARWNRVDVGAHVERVEDHSNRLTDEEYEVFGTVAGPLQSLIQVNLLRNSERVGEELFSGLDRFEVYGEVQPSGWIKASLFAEGGDSVFVATAREAHAIELAPAVELKLGRHVNAKIDLVWQRFTQGDTELSDAHLTQLRLVYSFSTRCFARAIVQYLDLSQDPTAYPEPVEATTQTLFTQLLFSYKLNPQTVLFLGYSDNRLGVEDISLTRTDRTFFAKLGYALLL